MERSNNGNWILCPSKSFPGKLYYFNVLTGEAAWTLSEMENARAMQKNSYITKANRWHTYPEPNSPPDKQYIPEPSWQRKPGQHPFSRPIMASFGERTFPVYRSQYTTPKFPNMMHNPTPIGPIIKGDMKKYPDLQNMWGYDRDPYSPHMDTMKRFVQWEKPPVTNINHASSAPIESLWSYDYQNIGASPIVGQNLSKAAPMYEPRTNVNKEFTQWRTQFESSNVEKENSLFRTKHTNNLRSLDESASFDQRRLSQKNAQFTPKSSIFQGTRIFGTRPYEEIQTLGDSKCFEMPKPKNAVQKNIILAQPFRNVRLSKPILNKNVSSLGNLMSRLSLTPHKRPQSVPSDQEKEIMMNGGKDWKCGLRELSEDDLRYKVAKKKKYDKPQVQTVTKIKTSYSNTNVTTPVKKRVTFAMDFKSNDNEGTEYEQNDEFKPQVKGKQPQKNARTFVNGQHNLKTEKKVSLTKPNHCEAGAETDYIKHFNSNDTQKAKKIKLGDTSDMSGTTLLRNMAIKYLNKVPTLQNIDVEKGYKDSKELMGMIDSMIRNADEDATESNIAAVNDGNNNTNQVCDENQAASDNKPRFVITFGNFTIRKVDMQYNDDKNKTTSVNDAPKENKNNSKHENPKILKKISLVHPTKDKKDKSNENLDLDALAYEKDNSEEQNNDADATCTDIEINDSNNQVDKESPQNYNRNNDKQYNEMNDLNQHAGDESPRNFYRNGYEQNHVNIDTDTTKDNGFENDSLHDYFLNITCLTNTKLRELIMHVYNFLSRASKNMRDENIEGDTKVALHQKTSKGCQALAKIIRGLESIIAKESDDRTCMRTALMKTRVHAIDSRIIKYRQVITKYLHQIRILEEAMQVLVKVTRPAPPSDDGHGTDSSLT